MHLHFDPDTRELLVDGFTLAELSMSDMVKVAEIIRRKNINFRRVKEELSALKSADHSVFTTLIDSIKCALESEDPKEWLQSILDDAYAANGEFLAIYDALSEIERLIDEAD